MKQDLNCADLLISNVSVYNSYFRKFNNADAYIKEGKAFQGLYCRGGLAGLQQEPCGYGNCPGPAEGKRVPADRQSR